MKKIIIYRTKENCEKFEEKKLIPKKTQIVSFVASKYIAWKFIDIFPHHVMISGSESIDLYYLKYFVASNTTNRLAIASGLRSQHQPDLQTIGSGNIFATKRRQPYRPAAPPPASSATGSGPPFDNNCGSNQTCAANATVPPPLLQIPAAIETLNMLIGRFAVILSLVGWRVKPDPGDWQRLFHQAVAQKLGPADWHTAASAMLYS